MSTVATPSTASPRRRGASHPARGPASRPAHPLAPEPDGVVNPHHRGGTILFEVPFTSAMSDHDLSVLAHTLDLWRHMSPKMRPDPNSPGVARLDHFSGLFLERGAGDDRWLMQARTWGRPAPQTVERWHMLAAQAARRLDPDVTLPEPAPHRFELDAEEVHAR